MKKFIVILIVVFSLTACNENVETNATEATTPKAAQSESVSLQTSEVAPAQLATRSNEFLEIDADEFITALEKSTTDYDMCKWGERREFVSDEKEFESYILENILGNSYIAISHKDDNTLTDIYMTCPRGAIVYYYAANIIYSIDESIDYKEILKSLSIDEEDSNLEGMHVMQPNGMNIVFERKEDSCVLTIMFYE